MNREDVTYAGVSGPWDLRKFFPLLAVRNAVNSSTDLNNQHNSTTSKVIISNIIFKELKTHGD